MCCRLDWGLVRELVVAWLTGIDSGGFVGGSFGGRNEVEESCGLIEKVR